MAHPFITLYIPSARDSSGLVSLASYYYGLDVLNWMGPVRSMGVVSLFRIIFHAQSQGVGHFR